MISNDLRKRIKQCLSIVDTATAKDDEIDMWTEAAIADLERQGIYARGNVLDRPLVVSAIALFVRAHFGMSDERQKDLNQKTYNLFCHNLSLSGDYLETGADYNA